MKKIVVALLAASSAFAFAPTRAATYVQYTATFGATKVRVQNPFQIQLEKIVIVFNLPNVVSAATTSAYASSVYSGLTTQSMVINYASPSHLFWYGQDSGVSASASIALSDATDGGLTNFSDGTSSFVFDNYNPSGYSMRGNLTSFSTAFSNVAFAGPAISISISDISSNVPEPATWAMFIGGFGLVGGAMRNRRRTNVRFA
jgi:hypothetical protein